MVAQRPVSTARWTHVGGALAVHPRLDEPPENRVRRGYNHMHYSNEAAPPSTINGQTVELGENIKSGKVMLDPATGEELRKLLREQVDQVDSWLARAGRLARPAPLGANPVSDAMSTKFESRAEGD